MGLDGYIYKTYDTPDKKTNARNPWWEKVPPEEIDYDTIYLEQFDRRYEEDEAGVWWREKDDVAKSRSIAVAEFQYNWTLHLWMRKVWLWKSVGGKFKPFEPGGNDFNYPDSVELDIKDLDRLIRHVREAKMPFAEGRPHRHDRNAKAEMIVAAREAKEAIKEGYYVYYIGAY